MSIPIEAPDYGALAIDERGFAWQLWSFDPRPEEPWFWICLYPALYLGFTSHDWRSTNDVPGRVIHNGLGWEFHHS